MSEFKEIKTQEEFEARMKERLEQKERSVSKKYEGYKSPEELAQIEEEYKTKASKQFEGYKSPDEVEALKKEYEGKIAKYESDSVKTRIASELGLPSSIASRLKGANEDEIRKDAETFVGFFQKEPPLATGEPTVVNDEQAKDIAYKNLVKNLDKGE